MNISELENINSLIKKSKKLSISIAHCSGAGGTSKPEIKFDPNFEPLFNEFLRRDLHDGWIDECLVNLKAQKLEVDSEIRKTIKDW